MLTVSLLGTPDFVLDRTSLTTLPKRTKALVCLLAETPGERYGRDRLVDLLWPDVDETTGRHRLRSCLLALRNALKPHQADTLVAEGDGLHLASEAVEVDTSQLEQFSTSQDAGALAIAAALYRGEFLDGFPFVSEGFDDWARRRRAHYAMLASDMLTRLTRLQSEAGDHSAATATATKLIGLDPLSEDAHRMLIGVHIRAGRHSNALKQYRECARILEEELGVAPRSSSD